jgi:hypothetical protein
MRLISLDSETELIARGRQVPPLVVVSYAELCVRSREPRVLSKGLVRHQDARAFIAALLADPEIYITGANIAYDVLVSSARWPNPDPDAPSYDEEMLAAWVRAYDADRVSDLLTRQKLLDLAAGCYRREQLPDGRWAHHKYNLAALAWRLCRLRLDKGDPGAARKLSAGKTVAELEAAQAEVRQAEVKRAADAAARRSAVRLGVSSEAAIGAALGSQTTATAAAKKSSDEQADDDEEQDAGDAVENSWRLRYAELKDVPIREWPEAARSYALTDAVAGALVWHAQELGSPVAPWLTSRNVSVPVSSPVPSHSYPLSAGTDTNPSTNATPNGHELYEPFNIWSGSTEGEGLSAALTNPTELSRRKGTVSRSYPLTFEGQTWPDLEAAWFALSPAAFTAGGTAAEDALMACMVAAKFEQQSRLARAVERRGGAEWLLRCSHFTDAKSRSMQAWEGRGESSRFIRNLAAGFRQYQEARKQPPVAHAVGSLGSSLNRSQPATSQPATLHAQPATTFGTAGHLAGRAQTPSGGSVRSEGTTLLTSIRYAPTPGQLITDPAASLWERVRENFGADANPFVDQYRQARGALWLRAMSAHGLRTDPEAVARFSTFVEHKHREVTIRLVQSGLVRTEWHLDRDALRAWVVERCREMNTPELGVKKGELSHLAELLGAADPNAAVAETAANWLSLIRRLRADRPEPLSIEESELRQAEASFDLLERHKLAHRTFHRNTKAAARTMIEACERAGIPIPRTESYDPRRHSAEECVALDKEACQSARDGDLDGRLTDYAELSHLAKILSADVPVLRSGTTAPIHTHFEELLETGRTGSAGPNVQNRSRGDKCDKCKGKSPARQSCERCAGTGAELGDRECYVPRPMIWDATVECLVPACLVDSDYSLGELHTLAQICLWVVGQSRLADVLRSGKDPHTAMACEILGLLAGDASKRVPYEEGVRLKKLKDLLFDSARNAAKAVNFGKPGGLGVDTMRAYAVRSYGVDLPADKWAVILALWEQLWTEMPLYFEWCNSLRGKKGRAVVEKGRRGNRVEQLYNLKQLWSDRLRAGATYCSVCNSGYQGLLADIGKAAGWYIFKACYLRPGTAGVRFVVGGDALYGCRPVNFIHDQFLIEAPESRGDAAARSTKILMDKAGEEILPDVPVKCEPILARRWSKRAEELRVAGELVPWEDARLRSKPAALSG